MTPREAIIESINVHLWRYPFDERDSSEALQLADEIITDLKAAGYTIMRPVTPEEDEWP